MGRSRTAGRRAWSINALSSQQWLELMLGFAGERESGCVDSCNDLAHDVDSGCPTWFADATEASTAWFACRDELLAGAPGVRPAGWWRWEARRQRPPTSEQYSVLAEMGVLEPWEVAAMRARDALADTATEPVSSGV